jgi:hypothetical protein
VSIRALVLPSSACTRGIRVHALELFRLYLPLHFELAQVAEQRPFVGGQSIGLALKRLQPLGGAPRHRFGPCSLGQRLSETRRNRRDRKDRGDKRRENDSLHSQRAQSPVPSPLKNRLPIYI